MKKRFILFACIVISAAFTTCRNEQVIGLLRFPSELDFLEVETYNEGLKMEGGAALQPGLRASVYEYTAHAAKDTTRFVINAGFNGKGTVKGYCEKDQITGTGFDFYEDEKVITLTVQKEWMKPAQYRLTVIRGDPVPVAENIKISVDPPIGAFFIGRNVIPQLEVTARLPDAGGELSYQWYMNVTNDTRSGYLLTGETGTTYTMRKEETYTVRTVYYYVEITNTIDGKTSMVVSPTRSVAFLNKNELDDKSRAMINIPVGNVTDGFSHNDMGSTIPVTWNTPGYKIGQYLVTWELWRTVADCAEAGGYSLARSGNQGAAVFQTYENSTNTVAMNIGNQLNPVTNIGWREAVIWCNAYSEMEGLDPVYRTSSGTVLRDSRLDVDKFIDPSKMAGNNGYRLPTIEEWLYAAKGANPANSAVWNKDYPGPEFSADLSEKGKYLWAYSPLLGSNGMLQTTEVGSLLPNAIELYDLMGMVNQWVWWTGLSPNPTQQLNGRTWGCGWDFYRLIGNGNSRFYDLSSTKLSTEPNAAFDGLTFFGFRLAQD